MCGLLVYTASMVMFIRTERIHDSLDAEQLGKAVVSSIRAVLREPELVLKMASGRLASKPNCNDTLAAAQKASYFFRHILVLDDDDRVMALYPHTDVYAEADYINDPFIEKLKKSNDVCWSSIHAGLDGTRELSVGLSMKSGIILGLLDFDSLSSRLTELLGNAAAGLSIADSGCTLIVHRDVSRIDRRELDKELFKAVFDNPGAVEYRFKRYDSWAAPPVIARRIPETGWYVIVERPAEFVSELFKDSLPWVSVLTVAVICLSAGLSFSVTRLLLRDVQLAGRDAEDSEKVPATPMFFRETESILLAARTVADRLRNEEAANQHLNYLNNRLEKTLLELRNAQEALLESERTALRGMMAASMAHELNTPIAAAESAAAEAGLSALHILSEYSKSDERGATVRSLALALYIKAEAWDPNSAPLGMERRSMLKELERALCGDPGASGEQRDTETPANLVLLANRLIDIGLTRHDVEAVLAAKKAFCDDSVRCQALISTAEIVVSCKLIRAGMDKAARVVAAIRGVSPADDRGAGPTPGSDLSVEEAVALFYAIDDKARAGVGGPLEGGLPGGAGDGPASGQPGDGSPGGGPPGGGPDVGEEYI